MGDGRWGERGAAFPPLNLIAAISMQRASHDQPTGDVRMTEIGDPIAFELFKNAIFSIADEMALTVVRTT